MAPEVVHLTQNQASRRLALGRGFRSARRLLRVPRGWDRLDLGRRVHGRPLHKEALWIPLLLRLQQKPGGDLRRALRRMKT